MKVFIIKFFGFALILFMFTLIYIYSFSDKDIDPFYRRFTVKKQSSLILGSSRAAQGLEPLVLMKKLDLDSSLYNYSFTMSRSIWGPYYLESIKRKLEKNNSKSAVFILECNPWSFVSKIEAIGEFPEKNAIPNSILFPNLNPNFQYFFGGYGYPNIHLLINYLKGKSSVMYVNDFGRLVVNVKYDSLKIEERIANKMNIYEKMLNNKVIDSLRLNYLSKTVDFLSKRGKVYLVRLPVAPRMLELEEELLPNFNTRMENIQNSKYIDLTHLSDDFITSDGNHVHNKYTLEVTRILGDSIKISGF